MATDVDFDGRIVIVTGAGGGMGRSHARMLASRGARVVVNDIRGGPEVAAEIQHEGGRAVAAEHDISSEAGASAIVRTALDAYGGVDALVNNAGVSCHVPFEDLTVEQFDRTQKVNMYGPFFLNRAAWPHLRSSGAGRIVMVASKSAVTGARGLTAYAASKGAMLAMARQLAAEGAPIGIHVNAVLPSAVTPMRRAGGERFANQLGLDPADSSLADHSCAVTSAVVAWLCHPDCTANGEFVNAVGGEASRFTFTKSKGFTDPDLTVEMVRDHFDTVMDMGDASFPQVVWDGDLG